MQTKNRNTYTTIHTEGALLPIDLLQRIGDNDPNLPGLTPEAYHLAPGEKINEAINRSWNRLSGLWTAFQNALQKLPEGDFATTLTRERWLLPLFQELGYGRLSTTRAVEIEGKSYAISHRWEAVPIHLVGASLKLDRATPGAAGAARTNPHSLLQEYLNRTVEVQWGILSNGLSLRILRDNATLTRQAYLEFELESMFNGEVYADFVLLWLLCHQSRFETSEKQSECLLESWSKNAQESGTRALDTLREGVENAIKTLGQGFLQQRQNNELRSRLKSGELSAQDYYRQLLRLVYRLIFLFTAEDRELLMLPEATLEAKQCYEQFYSTTRLRQLAERQRGSRHHDRYEALRLVMNLLGSNTGCPELALPALGGFLFDPASMADINNAFLDNQSLLTTVRWLSSIREGNTRRVVDYRNLGPEELGSVYESLLELHPLLNTDAGTFDLSSAAGNERKTTGSYYTPTSLIKVLLDSTLDPVIEDRVRASGRSPAEQEAALLDLNVCDPACGSGHFLIAAAHRIANRLAQVRSRGDEPSPEETRHALRDVIRHCIYGVDINPMAVELCKVNLWLESLEPGKPLSFLDAHIKCGNSLVGVGPKMDLDTLEIPDDAFKSVIGDHKPTSALLRKRNKQEREGQESLFVTVLKTQEDLDGWLAQRAQAIEDMPEDDAEQVQAKSRAYEEINQSEHYLKQRQIADLWTAAFFWKIAEPAKNELSILAPTQGQLQRLRKGNKVQEGLLQRVNKVSQAVGFFHWQLENPDVHSKGGFDCVLGNPPWERIKIEERDWFASRSSEIANSKNSTIRKKLINSLVKHDTNLMNLFSESKNNSESKAKFFSNSKCYPLGAVGDINTFSLFADLNRQLINENGMTGFIAPTSLITDYTYREFFYYLISKQKLHRVYDFDNSENIFNAVDRNQKFCLLILGKNNPLPSFSFGLKNLVDILSPEKTTTITLEDIELVSPNTKNCPAFQTTKDSILIRDIYKRVPILYRDLEKKSEEYLNFWTMFHMSNDSNLFTELPNHNIDSKTGILDEYYRLYEGKMIWQYDHRFSNAEPPKLSSGTRGKSDYLSISDKKNPHTISKSRYFVHKSYVHERAKGYGWFIGYREIAGAVANIRTMVSTIIPLTAVGNKILLIGINDKSKRLLSCCLLGNFNSLIFDYIVRQRITGISLSFYIIKQIPTLPLYIYEKPCPWNPKILLKDWIIPRVVKLCYTSWDLNKFANDCGFNSPPFQWDENQRFQIKSELDAAYFYLYNIDRSNIEFVMDSFGGLMRKEEREYGEYRTRRLVLEAWDRLAASGELPAGREFSLEASPEIIQPAPATTLTSQNPPVAPRETKVSPPKPKPQPGPAPLLDFAAANPQVEEEQLAYGFYKCSMCGRLKMHFDVKEHEKEHAGRKVEWKKIG